MPRLRRIGDDQFAELPRLLRLAKAAADPLHVHTRRVKWSPRTNTGLIGRTASRDRCAGGRATLNVAWSPRTKTDLIGRTASRDFARPLGVRLLHRSELLEPLLERRAERLHLGIKGADRFHVDGLVHRRNGRDVPLTSVEIGTHGIDRRRLHLGICALRGAPSVEEVLQPGQVGKQQEGLVEAIDEAHKVAGGERTAQEPPTSAGRVVE